MYVYIEREIERERTERYVDIYKDIDIDLDIYLCQAIRQIYHMSTVWVKETYKRDLQKRPTKETCKRWVDLDIRIACLHVNLYIYQYMYVCICEK